MRSIVAAIVIALFGACGRIGFDTPGEDDPAARLASIELWTTGDRQPGTRLPIGFDPQLQSYALDVGLSLQNIWIAATPEDPSTTIVIAGVPVPAGVLSAPSTLVLGTTSVVVTGVATSGARASYTVEITRAGAISQQTYVKASNTGRVDLFARAISLDGNTLAVGAWAEDSGAVGIAGQQADETAPGSGAVYVFTRSGDTWAQEAYIKASNTDAGDQFGLALALSGDTLAVGAQAESSSATGIGGDQANNSALSSGAVYVFTRAGTTWSQQAYVKASNTEAFDNFGSQVALSDDTLAVIASSEDSSATGVGGNQADNGALFSGAAYVFVRSGTTWSQQAYLKASNAETGDFFGGSLALAGDTLAIGAANEDSNAKGVGGNEADNSATESGAVYVFTRVGTTWSQQAYLKASAGESNDGFGNAVTIAGDTLAVGAPREDSSSTGVGGDEANNGALDSGAVYVFTRVGGAWSQQAYIKPSTSGPEDLFGGSVALSGDLLAVGALLEDSRATGTGGDETDNGAFASGAAYVLTRTGELWSQLAYLKPSNTEASDTFGATLSLSSTTLAIGAPFEDSSATGVGGTGTDNGEPDSGALYLFR